MTTTPHAPLTLISHLLCPYVQRAAIVLQEKGVPFERRDIDLANKPDWFLKVSPLGKTPVLLVGEQPIFESAVICEYLDETLPPKLHPADALKRAQHRAWIEFGSSVLATIWTFCTTPDEATLQTAAGELRAKFGLVEQTLGEGPYFAGGDFSIVDAVFGPVFRYFDVFDTLEDFAFFENTPKVRAWRAQLATRPSVQQAVRADYADLLKAFLAAKGSALAGRKPR
jgi:glutathione S-transferase